ncbi:MAG TPA: adenylate kinase family protein [Methanoregulaceae archaeon]|nr:adenylate kinase family protein [Methanoregulaceae archaeon]
MMYGISGTPGTGKTTIAEELSARGHPVLHLAGTTDSYRLDRDEDRDTYIIDEERWAREFIAVEGFVEGHLAHLLPCDLVIVLRCRPDVLAGRLSGRGYSRAKIAENAEAEALDVILIECLEGFEPRQIYELDTTDKSAQECCEMIEGFVRGKIPPSFGEIDWSHYLGTVL